MPRTHTASNNALSETETAEGWYRDATNHLSSELMWARPNSKTKIDQITVQLQSWQDTLSFPPWRIQIAPVFLWTPMHSTRSSAMRSQKNSLSDVPPIINPFIKAVPIDQQPYDAFRPDAPHKHPLILERRINLWVFFCDTHLYAPPLSNPWKKYYVVQL